MTNAERALLRMIADIGEEYWILDDEHRPVKAHSIIEWGKFFQSTNGRIVARDQIGDTCISTVFLGIDHGWGEGAPVLFEKR